MQPSRHPQRARTLAVTISLLATLASWTGCQSGQAAKQTADSQAAAPSVRIDRTENGAALANEQEEEAAHNLPRTLSFQMTGRAEPADTGATTERRAAAVQAAIMDSLCQAVIEARRTRGRSTHDFTAELGPRLRVSHRTVNSGGEVQVTLIAQGTQTTWIVRDKQLQHPAHDLQLVRQVFEETNGEFSLLGTNWEASRGEYVATVGCYLPKGLNTAIASDAPHDGASEGAAVP